MISGTPDIHDPLLEPLHLEWVLQAGLSQLTIDEPMTPLLWIGIEHRRCTLYQC
jgi:hypothetical protein